MDYADFRKLTEKLFFTVGYVAALLGIRQESARVLCSRYVKRGIFIRLKNNLYVLEENLPRFSGKDFFMIANRLQVPSYVSFLTALAWYEVTTQVPRNFFESASLKRSVRFEAGEASFSFYKLKRGLYFDFIKQEGYFMAAKEKAFLDSAYLFSLGRYAIDFSAIDMKKLDASRLKKLLQNFPDKTKKVVKGLCGI